MRSTLVLFGLTGCIVPWDGTPYQADDAEATPADTETPGWDDEPSDSDTTAAIDSSPLDNNDDDDVPGGNSGVWDGSDPADWCADAESRGSIEAGFFTGSMSGFTTSGLDPSCFSYSTQGPDAFHKVVLQSGQTIRASFVVPGADSQLYMLRDCQDGSTCIVGVDDAFTGSAESFQFTNNSGTEQTAYLVLGVFQDVPGIGSFDLIVEID